MEIYDKSNYSPSKMSTGFPGGSDGKKKKKKNPPAIQEIWV